MNILLQVDHPFLMNMRYVFQNEQRIFFIMDLIRGGDLWSYMEQPFTEEITRFYIVQIATALGYLHERNIIHRDLKAENILMKEDGYLCLIDFGTAQRVKNKNERRMTLAGTDGC